MSRHLPPPHHHHPPPPPPLRLCPMWIARYPVTSPPPPYGSVRCGSPDIPSPRRVDFRDGPDGLAARGASRDARSPSQPRGGQPANPLGPEGRGQPANPPTRQPTGAGGEGTTRQPANPPTRQPIGAGGSGRHRRDVTARVVQRVSPRTPSRRAGLHRARNTADAARAVYRP